MKNQITATKIVKIAMEKRIAFCRHLCHYSNEISAATGVTPNNVYKLLRSNDISGGGIIDVYDIITDNDLQGIDSLRAVVLSVAMYRKNDIDLIRE